MADETVSVAITGDASSLDKAIANSQAKIKALGADLAGRGENVKTLFTEATQSLSELNAELGKGKGVSDAQGTAISELTSKYSSLAITAARGNTEILEGQTKNITSLRTFDSALEKTGNRGLIFAGGVIAIGEAFDFGFRKGEQLRKGLNELSDGAFDDLIQKLPQFELAMAALGPAEETAAEKAELLNNQLNILRKNGIDPTGLSAAEVQAKVDSLGKHLQDFGDQFNETTAKIKAANKELELYAEAVDKGGEVTTENADKIVADAEKQIKAINELPATERAAFADRIKLYQGFIEQYTAATTKFQENTEKEAEAAEKGADREIAALKKVEEEREKADAKKLESLQKTLDLAEKAADKGGGDGPSDKAIGNTKELTKEAEKLKGQIADIKAKPLLTVEDENLLDSYRSTLHDLNDQLGKSSDNFGAIDRASNAAGEQIAAIKDAENALNTELNKQGELAQEAAIAQAVAATQYNKTAISVEKLADGTLKFSNTADDNAISIEKLNDGLITISNTQGDLQSSQADLNTLMEKYGPASKDAADAIKDHLHPVLDETHRKMLAIEDVGKRVLKVLSDIGDTSGGGQGGGF